MSTIAIVNGTILTITRGIIEKGTVVVRDGKIAAVGPADKVAAPKGASVYDATDKTVMPGMIDAHCHVGVAAEGVGYQHADLNERTDPITPHLRAIDAIHPEDPAFKDLREAGVTTINTGPGSANLIGGQFACVKTKRATTVEEIVVMAPSAMKMALGENPKRVYGDQKRMPSTRMANTAVLRTALVEADNYRQRLERYRQKLSARRKATEKPRNSKPEPPDRNLKHEALLPVLDGTLRAMIHCHRADDIMTAIRIGEEFGLRFSLEHCTEGFKIADILAEKKIPCVVGPILFSRMKYELRDMTPENPAALSRAGARVIIQSDEMSAVKYLLISAGLAVQYGMAEDEALKAITIYPAELIGVAERIGSIEKGKDADVVVFSGHPLDYRSRADLVLIDGRVEFSRNNVQR